jgi:hypothetical protein
MIWGQSMRGGRRHPSRMQLEAWFDGELPVDAAPADMSWHLTECPACFRHLETLSRMRVGVRRAAGAPVLPETVPAERLSALATAAPPRRHLSRVLVAVPAAAVLVAAAVVGTTQLRVHDRLSADHAGAGTSSSAHGASPSATGTKPTNAPGSTVGSTQGRSSSSATSVASGAPGAPTRGLVVNSPIGTLTLAVVVPTQGAAAAEGAAITDAVRQAVADANASGGFHGAPVQLTVVPAENSAAVAGLAGTVTAVVGGFGNSPSSSLPWLLPADPWASGPSVVASELTPAEAGARLGQDLLQRGDNGAVGVVMGSGPDTGLEAGLAQEVPVVPVAAPSSGVCLPAATALEAQGVQTVAVAGSPALAASCASALGTQAWAPPGGVLLPPSAAYGGVTTAGLVPGTGVYTVLGLPWPGSSDPGAARFRSEVPGVTSYRALVSFAAVEMAVQVARSTGSLALDKIAAGSWQNDLYDFAGVANVGARVVQESASGWVSAP